MLVRLPTGRSLAGTSAIAGPTPAALGYKNWKTPPPLDSGRRNRIFDRRSQPYFLRRCEKPGTECWKHKEGSSPILICRDRTTSSRRVSKLAMDNKATFDETLLGEVPASAGRTARHHRKITFNRPSTGDQTTGNNRGARGRPQLLNLNTEGEDRYLANGEAEWGQTLILLPIESLPSDTRAQLRKSYRASRKVRLPSNQRIATKVCGCIINLELRNNFDNGHPTGCRPEANLRVNPDDPNRPEMVIDGQAIQCDPSTFTPRMKPNDCRSDSGGDPADQ
ncbi:hypothetical protein FNV43_RR17082 [Rhamnella rubrinervis]|uniref:Uncharacterized protein n=1 Tax=Rhamnella rubrinervis TaxID=2594499 RepID=A0A8K0GZY5_9ROSA|nr:hypothetical protein FNV43_RR17082 [Rhamnella rubrinervis]